MLSNHPELHCSHIIDCLKINSYYTFLPCCKHIHNYTFMTQVMYMITCFVHIAT